MLNDKSSANLLSASQLPEERFDEWTSKFLDREGDAPTSNRDSRVALNHPGSGVCRLERGEEIARNAVGGKERYHGT